MNNNFLKKAFIVSSFVLLAASCSSTKVSETPNPTPGPTPSPIIDQNYPITSIYNSPTNDNFSISYPEDFSVTTNSKEIKNPTYIPTCDENTKLCVYYTGQNYKDTNFEGAGVSVNILSSLNTQAKCYNFKVSTNEAQEVSADYSINGIIFKTATGGDAGAGHFVNTKAYRYFYNGVGCYELVSRVAATNIGNYEPGTIKEFKQDEINAKLFGIVTSFKFTKAPGSLSETPVTNKQTTLYGEVVCLPHKNPDQPHTMECAIGLQEEGSGKYYSLKNTKTSFFETGVKVKVSGMLIDDSNSNYNVAGAIDGASVTKQ